VIRGLRTSPETANPADRLAADDTAAVRPPGAWLPTEARARTTARTAREDLR
jgi:hypothetical protein